MRQTNKQTCKDAHYVSAALHRLPGEPEEPTLSSALHDRGEDSEREEEDRLKEEEEEGEGGGTKK